MLLSIIQNGCTGKQLAIGAFVAMGLVALVVVVIGIVVAVVLVQRSNLTFREGFQQCCNSQSSCLDELEHFSQGYSSMNTTEYNKVLRALGMGLTSYDNALFWTSNGVRAVPKIVESISDSSPPSSFNIPAGVFGNCISNFYGEQLQTANILPFWTEYSRLMADNARGYVFWLTTADNTMRYFPAVMMGMERIWERSELPNLNHSKVTGVIVLNARSQLYTSALSCNEDTESGDKLFQINSDLEYFCCDIALTNSNVSSVISTMLSGDTHHRQC